MIEKSSRQTIFITNIFFNNDRISLFLNNLTDVSDQLFYDNDQENKSEAQHMYPSYRQHESFHLYITVN